VRTRFVGIALTTLLLMASAYADAVFTLGNHPQPGEQNIMFHTAMTGTMVSGTTNQTHNQVVFLSNQTLHVSGGQSDVDAVSGSLTNITITAPLFVFKDYILNPFKDTSGSNISVKVVMGDGHTFFVWPLRRKWKQLFDDDDQRWGGDRQNSGHCGGWRRYGSKTKSNLWRHSNTRAILAAAARQWLGWIGGNCRAQASDIKIVGMFQGPLLGAAFLLLDGLRRPMMSRDQTGSSRPDDLVSKFQPEAD
jgi:hypothetical protein